MISPPVQVGSRWGRSEFTLTGLKRPPLPDWVLTNSYLLARGPVSTKEEMSVPGLEDVMTYPLPIDRESADNSTVTSQPSSLD